MSEKLSVTLDGDIFTRDISRNQAEVHKSIAEVFEALGGRCGEYKLSLVPNTTHGVAQGKNFVGKAATDKRA